MQSNKQLRREAKLLFRFCLVRGMLDEVRVIEAVRKVLKPNAAAGSPYSRTSDGW